MLNVQSKTKHSCIYLTGTGKTVLLPLHGFCGRLGYGGSLGRQQNGQAHCLGVQLNSWDVGGRM